MSYDAKCEELAMKFLSDHEQWWVKHPGATAELAQQIQDAIEDFLIVKGLADE